MISMIQGLKARENLGWLVMLPRNRAQEAGTKWSGSLLAFFSILGSLGISQHPTAFFHPQTLSDLEGLKYSSSLRDFIALNRIWTNEYLLSILKTGDLIPCGVTWCGVGFSKADSADDSCWGRGYSSEKELEPHQRQGVCFLPGNTGSWNVNRNSLRRTGTTASFWGFLEDIMFRWEGGCLFFPGFTDP